MLIGEIGIAPSDGVIASPEELSNGLNDMLANGKLVELNQCLEAMQELTGNGGLRLSLGLEDSQDLIKDLKQALQ